MEKLLLEKDFINSILEYRDGNHLRLSEREIIAEIIIAIEANDAEMIAWYNQFGDAVRCLIQNVQDYRKGMEFGFTEIAFGTYQWLKRPEYLDIEELTFGNAERHSEHSIIKLGHGMNGVWTYGINYSFGLAGGGYGLSVYGKQFKSREDALTAGMAELKIMMAAKVGDTDTSNHKQPIILATLRDIAKMQTSLVQLSLF